MKDADHLRAQAARCVALQRGARRADVQHALGCLAQEYETAARATEQWRDHHGAARMIARLPLAWPVLVTQRHLAALLRASLAFWLPL
ncbi:MAG TPA: hypothetical protein VJO12_15755 [Stellaceae bacterium]|nr:hypothetical protein [Stellaceae bacterium]